MKNFMKIGVAVMAAILFSGLAIAQKGTNEPAGVARQEIKPPIIPLSGKLLKIMTGACERSTGRSPMGTHLILQSKDDKTINIHLGPIGAVAHIVDQLAPGQFLTINAFRTDQLPDNEFIAKSLELDKKIIHLRDNNLRPSWAYGRSKTRWGSCW